ncbi:MAG: hypothetical protein XD98_0113 [Microgenomates bacterium 39_6]|nr:MAG: hypothetical protein XD98_0113 [Microgenomates bacterium 39_6]
MNSKHKTSLLIALLIIVSIITRSYKIHQYLFFGFEQGRDALIIKDIIDLKDFVLVGPKTDLGGIFHGAWYYYLMAPIYFIGSGSPLFASFFLIVLNSLIPVVVFLFIKRISNSTLWAFLGGVLTSISFELIDYSRWLSNVSPAGLFVSLAFISLWVYESNKEEKFFPISVFFAVLAAQFQIILLIWFLWTYLILLITKIVKFPKIQTFIYSLIAAILLFLPMIIFNFRNQFITVQAAVTEITESQALDFNFFESINSYVNKLVEIFERNLFPLNTILAQFLFILFIAATVWWLIKRDRFVTFLVFWVLMSLPVLLFTQMIPLTQLYVGTGIGLIVLFSFYMKQLWSNSLGKVICTLIAIVVIGNFFSNLNYLNLNQQAFYKTIQDDLNYQDQLNLLTFINSDAHNDNYYVKAFTIPYY